MSSLTSLPEELLKVVMQHVPLQHRLRTCCLVSKKLQAAVAATNDLELLLRSRPSHRKQRAEAGLGWVYHYGQQLTRLSLKLRYLSEPIQQLPCQDLLELKLLECDVQLGAANGFPGVIQGCSKLTRLELNCYLVDAPAGAVVDSLSNLVHLQHLHVVPRWNPTRGWADNDVGGLSVATLPRLQHLTYLHVNSLSVENLLQLSGFTNLQELHLSAAGNLAVGPTKVPGLVFPASLHTLVMLSPVEAGVLSLLSVGVKDLGIDCEVEGPGEGPDSFFSHLAGLNLTRLLLQHAHIIEWPPACPAYSALTANSNLVVLEMYDAYLPPDIWPHVFAPSQQLPHLTSLVLFGTDADDGLILPPLWCASDLSNIVRCCPSLCDVVTDCLEPGQHVSELHKLTALTRLRLDYSRRGSVGNFDECVSGLAGVTKLKDVDVTVHTLDGTADSLLPLTSLTALTSFTCDRGQEGPIKLRSSTQVNTAIACN